MDPADTARANRSSATKRTAAGTSSGAQPASRAGGRSSSAKSMAPAVIAMAYAKAGQALELAGYSEDEAGELAMSPLVPAGRVMQFQAPLAGQQIDRLLNRVPAYRRVTALTGNSLLDDLAPLVLGPVLAVVMASNPAMQAALAPMFLSAMQASAAEVIKLEREQEKTMAAMSEHLEEAGERAAEMMADLFGPPDLSAYQDTDSNGEGRPADA